MSDERITDIPIPNECKNCIFSAFKQFQPRWIPVTEDKPRRCSDSHVLVTDFDMVGEAYYNPDGLWFDLHGNKLKGVTAWMPLPKPFERSEDAES